MVEETEDTGSIPCEELSRWMIDNGVSESNAEEIIHYMDENPKSEGYIPSVQNKTKFLLE